jgi:hypothetical protein
MLIRRTRIGGPDPARILVSFAASTPWLYAIE